MLAHSSALAHVVEIQGHDLGIVGEVSVGGKDLPCTANGRSANEEVDRRSGYALRAALIIHVGSLLIVWGVEAGLLKGAQLVAQSKEVCLCPHARKQFLAHRPYELSASLANEFAQGDGDSLFSRIKVRLLSTQGERPDRRVD